MYAETAFDVQSRHRSSSTLTAAAPADPRAELQRLFKSYDAACLDFDAEAVARLYDLPCLLSTQEGNGSFTSRGELRAAFARAFSGYRQQGLTGASLVSLTISTLSGDFAQGRAIWSLSNARGHDVMSFACHYTLRHAQGRWRIVHAVALDEAEKLARQKPRAAILSLR
jgi:ketosteroid isomerase-like protein